MVIPVKEYSILLFISITCIPFITLSPHAGVYGSSDLSSMIVESVKMAKFSHPNVMRLIGVCIDKGASPYIVMPYIAYGSLLSYLKKQRAELTLANDEDQELVCIYPHIVMYIQAGWRRCITLPFISEKQFFHLFHIYFSLG